MILGPAETNVEWKEWYVHSNYVFNKKFSTDNEPDSLIFFNFWPFKYNWLQGHMLLTFKQDTSVPELLYSHYTKILL
jgi:hypothetical protein